MELEENIQALFIQRKWTLSAAESCTGGALSARLVQVPDCSLYFQGGVVAYSNASKMHILKISSRLIEEKGAVSEEVALEMARGVRHQFQSTIGIAITGVAGPLGGSPQKPVGTVCFGISGLLDECWRVLFTGDRREIIHQAVQEGLSHLLSRVRALS